MDLEEGTCKFLFLGKGLQNNQDTMGVPDLHASKVQDIQAVARNGVPAGGIDW